MRILEWIGMGLCILLSIFGLLMIIGVGLVYWQELRDAKKIRNNYQIGALHARERSGHE